MLSRECDEPSEDCGAGDSCSGGHPKGVFGDPV
jgi:hypothetical protein